MRVMCRARIDRRILISDSMEIDSRGNAPRPAPPVIMQVSQKFQHVSKKKGRTFFAY